MSQLDNLPPDQRAVLSLLLRQGKSYGEVAGKLHIDEAAVRERAHAALAALGPRAISGLTTERREAIGDYLLGQQNGSELDATRRYLEGSAAGRGWARVVSGELRPLATLSPGSRGGALPEIPGEGEHESRAPAASVAAAAPADRETADRGTADTPETAGAGAATAQAADRPPGLLGAGRPSLPASRLGGLLLLVGLGAAIALVVVLLVNGGSGGGKGSGAVTGKTTTTNASVPGSSTTPTQVLAQAALAPVKRGSKASAQVAVIAQGAQRALAFRAQGLAPSKGFQYALWLANTNADASPLGLLPAVKADGASTAVEAVCGTPSGGATSPCVPSNYSRFKLVILTRETSARPTRPGTIVLGGALASPKTG